MNFIIENYKSPNFLKQELPDKDKTSNFTCSKCKISPIEGKRFQSVVAYYKKKKSIKILEGDEVEHICGSCWETKKNRPQLYIYLYFPNGGSSEITLNYKKKWSEILGIFDDNTIKFKYLPFISEKHDDLYEPYKEKFLEYSKISWSIEEDHLLLEVIDKNTNPLDNNLGEIVLTSSDERFEKLKTHSSEEINFRIEFLRAFNHEVYHFLNIFSNPFLNKDWSISHKILEISDLILPSQKKAHYEKLLTVLPKYNSNDLHINRHKSNKLNDGLVLLFIYFNDENYFNNIK